MKSNQLINETSPYLLQHAHNPVEWYPWGNEAFSKAEEENKLVLISIGYSACHWCHVMEHESFEDEEVAAIMNELFVCIKVDREERPDVDQIYMEAVQMITGQGGWPLNCFALPDGRPVWGGTYFPKRQWMQVLNQLHKVYQNEPEKMKEQADALTAGIRQNSLPVTDTASAEPDVKTALKKASTTFDQQYGGLGKAPKFPMPVSLQLILQLGHLNNDNSLLDFVYLTLDRMASGGIYDQAGGGFARYSVDAQWFAPHFEKMLYDNAQLISLYSNAFKITQDKNYQRIVDETIRFIERELMDESGLFYSALDADSEGEEGKFYTWMYEELQNIIGDQPHFYAYFNIRENGNWEKGMNILHADANRDVYARAHHLDVMEFEKDIHHSLEKLMQHRKNRIRPGLDDKSLTAWNALMISGLCDAYQAMGNEHYLQLAQNAMNVLLKTVQKQDGHLLRTAKGGNAKINAFLDDYAFTTQALIQLYEVTFDLDYLNKAQALTKLCIDEFYNPTKQIFYYTSKSGETLIARKTDLQDNVIPSSVGTMVHNLIRLSQLWHLPDYEQIADQLIEKMHVIIEQHPTYYAQWALLSALKKHRQELVICGDQAHNYRMELQKTLRAGAIYAGCINKNDSIDILKHRFVEGQTLIYRCQNKTCERPVGHPHILN